MEIKGDINWLLERMSEGQLHNLVIDLREDLNELRRENDALTKNNRDMNAEARDLNERLSDAWSQYKRSQDRVAELYNRVARIGSLLNKDDNELTDGEVIAKVVDVLCDEFKRKKGFFIDRGGKEL